MGRTHGLTARHIRGSGSTARDKDMVSINGRTAECIKDNMSRTASMATEEWYTRTKTYTMDNTKKMCDMESVCTSIQKLERLLQDTIRRVDCFESHGLYLTQ